MPRLTVLIPAYNAEAWLADAVRSCLGVTEVERVIVVDDGSKSAQADVVDSACSADERARVEVVRQANAGGAAARNAAIERFLAHAGAEWAVLLDHDDELTPGIARTLEVAERTGAAAAVSDRVEFRDDGWEKERRCAPFVSIGAPVRAGEVFRPIHVWTATGLMAHRRVFEAGCRFDPRLAIVDDVDFIRQACEQGPLVCSGEIGLRRREFVEGANLSGPKTLIRRVDDLVVLHEKWYEEEDAAGWRETMRWLLNQLLKRGVSGEPVDRLLAIFRMHGWSVPIKMRWRAARNRRRAQIAST